MSDQSGIEWTEATWNPIVGCKAVSPGCDNCYAARETSGRLAHLPIYAGLASNGVFTGEVRTVPERLDLPLRWKKPRRIFVNSMSDLFHPEVPCDFREKIFNVMERASRHTFQVLTKRPQAMAKWLWGYYDCDPGSPVSQCKYREPLTNVWVGTSIESDRYAFRANHLRETPASVRFLSLEPLLGSVSSVDLTDIDWVIVGGESGPDARPMHPDWVREIRDRCIEAKVPFFFKQWGEWSPGKSDRSGSSLTGTLRLAQKEILLDLDGKNRSKNELSTFRMPEDWQFTVRRGKRFTGRELDGRTWDEYPVGHQD